MMRAAAVLLLAVAAGCLNGSYDSTQDMSIPDMSRSYTFDLSNYDLSGLYNCVELNACEQACTTKACVYMCRNMATPPAVAKQIDLQSCLVQNCPTSPGGICAPDANGMLSMACLACIKNAQADENTTCTPSKTPECHKCAAEAQTCLADK